MKLRCFFEPLKCDKGNDETPQSFPTPPVHTLRTIFSLHHDP